MHRNENLSIDIRPRRTDINTLQCVTTLCNKNASYLNTVDIYYNEWAMDALKNMLPECILN